MIKIIFFRGYELQKMYGWVKLVVLMISMDEKLSKSLVKNDKEKLEIN